MKKSKTAILKKYTGEGRIDSKTLPLFNLSYQKVNKEDI